jgi:hypothetical protein
VKGSLKLKVLVSDEAEWIELGVGMFWNGLISSWGIPRELAASPVLK